MGGRDAGGYCFAKYIKGRIRKYVCMPVYEKSLLPDFNLNSRLLQHDNKKVYSQVPLKPAGGCHIINTPSVAWAVLQTPLSLIK